jgi:hypothetical protein
MKGPLIPSERRTLFLQPSTSELKPKPLTGPSEYTDSESRKRHCSRGEVVYMPPSPTSRHPRVNNTSYSAGQAHLAHKVRVTPILLANQNSARFRVSEIGDPMVNWAFGRLRSIFDLSITEHHCNLARTAEQEDFYKHDVEQKRKLITTWRLWKNDPGLVEFAQEHVKMGRSTAEEVKTMRQSTSEAPDTEGRNDHENNYSSNNNGKGNSGPDDEMVQVSPQRSGRHRSHVESVVRCSEEEMPVRRPERVKRCKLKASCKVNDGEVELNVEWTPRQPGLRSGASLQMRNDREKNVRLVDGLPTLIACKDGADIVEKPGKRTLVPNAHTQEVIQQGERFHDSPNDDSSDSSSGSPDFSSCRLGPSSSGDEQLPLDDRDDGSDRSSSSKYNSDCPPPQPPIPHGLPLHLVPARVPRSAGPVRHLPPVQKATGTANTYDKRNMLAVTRPSGKILAERICYLIPIQTSYGWPEPLTTPVPMPSGRSVRLGMTRGPTPTKISSAFASAIKTGRFPTTSPQAKELTPTLLKKPLSSKPVADGCLQQTELLTGCLRYK